jgi:hypothetical protein
MLSTLASPIADELAIEGQVEKIFNRTLSSCVQTQRVPSSRTAALCSGEFLHAAGSIWQVGLSAQNKEKRLALSGHCHRIEEKDPHHL